LEPPALAFVSSGAALLLQAAGSRTAASNRASESFDERCMAGGKKPNPAAIVNAIARKKPPVC
jgi:triphosphoribosyl-dephospho-CoA synthetase